MKILDARVSWMTDYDNHPSLEVLIEDPPNEEERVYSNKENIYFSCLEGMASYFAYSGPSDGFGGREFDIKMDDGTTKTLIGPWSSRAGAVNTLFGPIVDMAWTDDVEKWNGKRGCFMHGSLIFSLALVAAEMAKCHLVKVVDDDITWIPSMVENVVVKPRIKNRKEPYYERFVYNHSEIYETLNEAKDMTPKKIIGPCIKLSNGQLRSSGVMYRYSRDLDVTKGFMDDAGGFHTPSEAARFALKNGQIKTEKAELTVEDIRSWR